jgi:hypothetical protein
LSAFPGAALRIVLSVYLLGASALLLTACGGGGGGGGTGTPTQTFTGNPSIHDPLTDGPTVGDSLKKGAVKTAGRNNGTRLVYDATSQTTTAKTPGMTLQKNVVGGYDFVMNGKQTSFGFVDQKGNSKDSWEKTIKNPQGATVYSLALWNAGKGDRAGIETSENGQTFHKVIGYYMFDYSNPNAPTRERGHFIIGNETDLLRMAAKTKKATYDGYFYTNIMPVNGTPPDQALAVSGGMRFVADFDTDRVSGTSTSFNIREAGAPDFYSANYNLTMNETAITGNSFNGTIGSNYIWLPNGTYAGQFYGGNAQELAGVMTGSTGVAIHEGFFTAVTPPTVAP